MRLICPSCETEYEVHENMIPAEGRDVQCSSCMKTWFQSGPTRAAPEVAADLKMDTPAAPSAPRPERSDPKPTPPAAPHSTSFDDDDSDLSSLPPTAVAAMAAKRQSPKIDSEALDVIRDEVVREQSARRSDANPIETQIDLGIDDAADPTDAIRDTIASQADDITDDIDDVELEAALADDIDAPLEPATKSDRLPDIEEINSTLSEAPADYDDFDDGVEMTPVRPAKARSRSGFRLGFGLMLLLSAALVGLYVYAPAISNSVPAMAGFLETYVSTVDTIRAWLDRSAQDMVDQITKLLGTVNNA